MGREITPLPAQGGGPDDGPSDDGIKELCKDPLALQRLTYTLYSRIINIRKRTTNRRFEDAYKDLELDLKIKLLRALKEGNVFTVDDVLTEIEQTSLDYLTRAELRELASKYGIPYYGNYSSPNLRERIRYEQEQVRILREHFGRDGKARAIDKSGTGDGEDTGSDDHATGERADA